MIHFISFPGYVLALVHGIILGPDTSHIAIFLMFLMTGGASLILFLLTIGTVSKKKTSNAPIQ
ncbi:hypothetical protein ACN6MY_04710 [Peribacillus sp. B-H-3]|uniref:hypothetical protein n=1 Tax=Peribacillus sp. B-H-3 TaxID=3400420 RepID=UPI003B016A80